MSRRPLFGKTFAILLGVLGAFACLTAGAMLFLVGNANVPEDPELKRIHDAVPLVAGLTVALGLIAVAVSVFRMVQLRRKPAPD